MGADGGSSSSGVNAAFYVSVWIALSSSVILFNKYILHSLDFPFPIFLTTWHLIFSTIATRVLEATTGLLDGRKKVGMSWATWTTAVLPIGFFFSLSLIFSNLAYLYLSVAFIQMLKATTPVAVLFAGYVMGQSPLEMKTFMNVLIIVVGVMMASFGEIQFVAIGFFVQIVGIACEAIRLVMVQSLLNSKNMSMDPLTSLYYFAPVCAAMNFVAFLVFEGDNLSVDVIMRVGPGTLMANALVAFCLNVAVVFLIGKTSSLVLCLSGVLKDIILVVASVMIWGTPVTPLQLFGYSIALAGLVVYKSGAQLDRFFETPIPCFGSVAKGRKSSILVLAVTIITLSMMFSPSMVSPSSHGGVLDAAKLMLPSTMRGGVAKKLSVSDRRQSVDIVVTYGKVTVIPQFSSLIKELLSLKSISPRSVRVLVYTNAEISDRTAKFIAGTTKNSASEVTIERLQPGMHKSVVPLAHITTNYAGLADHTVFVNAERIDADVIKDRIENHLEPGTSFLPFSNYTKWFCDDSFPHSREVFSIAIRALCPREFSVAKSDQFVVSRNMILWAPLKMYLDLLKYTITNPVPSRVDTQKQFGDTIQRMWSVIFDCWQLSMVDRCTTDGDCQCRNNPPRASEQ